MNEGADPKPGNIGSGRRWVLIIGAAAVVIALDQLSKWWVVDNLIGSQPRNLVWTLRLVYAENTGMAFSRGSGSGPIIGLVALAIVAVLLVAARRMTSTAMLVLAGVVIGGALGNVIDRLSRVPAGGKFMSGPVVDFLDLQWWPVFNVADAAIVVGGIALALFSFREPVEQQTEPDEPTVSTSDNPQGDHD